jgi:four helix bundle protein
MGKITSVRELRVWQSAMDLAMRIFTISKRYSLADQIRRSSRSVPAPPRR